MKDGVAIYGGFAGTETTLAQRNFNLHPTILTGDLLANDSTADNSYHVVTSTNNNSTAILDGVKITGGNNAENGLLYPGNYGGGLLIANGSPTITNTSLRSNAAVYGGGVAILHASPTLINVTCRSNTASHGGGIYGNYSYVSINSSRMLANRADYGAGIYITESTIDATNTIFYNNQAHAAGGAVYVANNGQGTFLNDDLLDNSALIEGAILACSSNCYLNVVNSILWGNTPADDLVRLNSGALYMSYNDMQGGTSGIRTSFGTVSYTNNIEPPVDPRLSDPPNLDFHLLSDSPCIDKGDPFTGLPMVDIDGESRPKGAGGRVDVGVDEY